MLLSRLRILLITLLLATITLWITNQQMQSTSETKIVSDKPLAYSWQAIDTTIWKISPDEQSKHSIIHAENIHYKDELKKSEFISPKIQIIEKDSITTLSSLKGESINDEIVTFNGGVVITQSAISAQNQDNTSQTTLNTETLSYNSQTNQAYTDAKVFIKQYNGETTGTGLKADLTESEFELLSDVKGTYRLNKTQPKNLPSSQPIQSKGQ
ncbi:MAG: LPS export ABC transporter periplasmic protein LptC [Pseudomonadota bacterium]|nr:LPS export ABC transporter periplasmic protein LptC [Pseudomonadota bacterium]